jgi:hypothetical protein
MATFGPTLLSSHPHQRLQPEGDGMEPLAVAVNVSVDGSEAEPTLCHRSPITTPADVSTARGEG